MYDLHELTPSERICAFLEGELDGAQEDVIFEEIAQNRDLRSELREFYSTQKYIHSDSERIVAHESLKTGVMQAVGLEATRATPMRWAAILALWQYPFVKKGLEYTALIAATALIMFLIMKPENGSVNTRIDRPGGNVQTTIVGESAFQLPRDADGSQTADDSTPFISSQVAETYTAEVERTAVDSPAIDKSAASATKPTHRSTSSLSTSAYSDPALFFESTAVPRSIIGPATTADAVWSSAESVAAVKKPLLASSSAFPLSPHSLNIAQAGVDIGLRGIIARSYPEASVQPKSDPIFNNAALSVMVKLSETDYIGIEAGQEPFTQIFVGAEDRGKFEILQQPLLFWAGGVYQRDLTSFAIGDMFPYASAFIGATEVGPLGRTTIGLKYRPERRIALSLGLEGSLLAYQFQQTWFTTRKLGITYGISISF